MDASLSQKERRILLKLARSVIQEFLSKKELPFVDLSSLSPSLQAPGASFVTLTKEGDLRGCIGTLEAYQPLAKDVCEHAVAAATQDFRFPPLSIDELPKIKIEISRLMKPIDLEYNTPTDLVCLIRPHIDGVTLRDGYRRATFLPQVWEKLPEPEIFLSHLCQKMGVSPDTWRTRLFDVQTYQVEEFHE